MIVRKTKPGFREANLVAWRKMLHRIYGQRIPERYRWVASTSISQILEELSRDNLTHLFNPDGGGDDLEGVCLSRESGCIELQTGNPRIVKPNVLQFESFGDGLLEWAYFRLQLVEIRPSGVYANIDGPSEELDEDQHGRYYESGALDSDPDEEDATPSSGRTVVRHLHGSLVFFAKGSTYNRTKVKGYDAYEGLHVGKTADEFRVYIERRIAMSSRQISAERTRAR